MAEIRDPKRFYYAMRSKYMREASQIERKLTLAVTEEEDALLWEQYRKVMKRWRALKRPDSIPPDDAVGSLHPHLNRRPEFNDEYIELTVQLKTLYAQMNRMRSRSERYALENQIRIIKKKRAAATTYTIRQTGIPAQKP